MCFVVVVFSVERQISVLFIDNKDSVFCNNVASNPVDDTEARAQNSLHVTQNNVVNNPVGVI